MQKFKIVIILIVVVVSTTLVSCSYSPHNNINIISEKQDAYQMKSI